MSRRPFAFALAGGFLALSSVAWAAEDNTITVYKTPWCGCCTAWVKHLQRDGFEVRVIEREDLAPVRAAVHAPLVDRPCGSVGGRLAPAAEHKGEAEER